MFELERLESALQDCEDGFRHASHRAQEAYPAGARVIVRTQRFGHPAKEWEGEACGASVHVSRWGASVHLRVRNLKTGKLSTRYPSITVDGAPQVRLADCP